MKTSLRLFTGLLLAAVPILGKAEGSRELTPNNSGTTADLTSVNNTRAGFLTHDANITGQFVSRSFLKPSASTEGGTFSPNHRMFIRLKPNETLYYGVHRSQFGQAGGSYGDLVLTLRYATTQFPTAGKIVSQNTLQRNTTSTNESDLLTTQAGVIATAAQAQAGPAALNVNGYTPLSYTNNTGAEQEFWVEFTQTYTTVRNGRLVVRDEFANTGTQAGFNDLLSENIGTQANNNSVYGRETRSEYDYWDFTVVGTDGLEKKGRLHSKFWAFSSGFSATGTGYDNRLSATFALYTLVPSTQYAGRNYVKQMELAGMRPYVFSFVANANGSVSGGTAGTTFATRRKSQVGDTGYPEYENFVNDPDNTIWPSAPVPTFARTYQAFCNSVAGRGSAAFTTLSEETGTVNILIDLNNNGIKDGNDVLLEQVVATSGVPVTTQWNGLDAAGNAVTIGTTIKLSFTSTGAPVNFPIFDAEGNPDGFRVQNVRPSAGGNAYYDRLYWDDTNLTANSATNFPANPPAPDVSNQRLDGVVSSTGTYQGVHRWGNATNEVGNNYTVNTWTYGFISAASEQTYTYSYNCDFDGDGVSDANDVDDDNDGILDTDESFGLNPQTYTLNGAVKTDGTGVPVYLDGGYVVTGRGAWRDVNADGINDWFDTDLDGIPNHYDTDSDGDGLADAIEANNGKPVTNYVASSGRISGGVSTTGAGRGMPTSAQTGTNNGVSVFTLADQDGDGIKNVYDLDSDNDGILDLVEMQSSVAAPAGRFATGNGLAYRAPLGADADGDGIDNRFDPDFSGSSAVLYAWNTGTNPNTNPATAPTLPDYLDLDSDNDGNPDAIENNGGKIPGGMIANGRFTSIVDANYDGFSDAFSTTANPTITAVADYDQDAVPNYRDLDSDNDGIPDMIEPKGKLPTGATYEGTFAAAYAAANDSNGDGLVNSVDPYTTANATLVEYDTDGDGIYNFLDLDSDNDGISDMREANLGNLFNPAFTDADGRYLNFYVQGSDADGDGMHDDVDASTNTAFANPSTNQNRVILDSDGDGRVDYQDLDSDNDGIMDMREAQTTSAYRAATGADSDADGIDNAFDNNASGAIIPTNLDGDGFQDYRDSNSDNDAFPDWTEGFDDNHSGQAIDDLKSRATAWATANNNTSYYSLSGIAAGAPAEWMLDADNDRIPNFLDPTGNAGWYHDDNLNGIIDLFDPAYSGTPSTAPKYTASQSEADFRFASTQTPLPVELVDFVAKAARPDAVLTWATAQEKNNAFFAVERSVDGGTAFEEVGRVAGQGTATNRTNYRFTDKGVALLGRTTLMYRLRQVDVDGTTTYSSIRTVVFTTDGKGAAGVYPNPLSAGSKLDLSALPMGVACQVSLLTAEGKLVRSFQTVGGAVQPLATEMLPAGAYLLQIKAAGMPTQTLKLTKN